MASSAVRGSQEQVAAANLAARAESRLASSLGVTAAEASRLRVHASWLERDVGRATRGALAGSGVFRGLGRSIAFASGGFLAFASAGQFLRTSVDAAKEAIVTQKQLRAQFRASGLDLGVYEGEIDKTANRLSLLAGFENDEVKAAFTTIFRTTRNVSKSLRDTATAADLARAKHMSLSQAALIVAKTEAGNTTLLRRQGFQIAKTATAEEALATLRRVVAGQAKAGTTEQERFGAVLHNTEEIIGTGILPTMNKYLAAGAVWLTQMNESGRLQRDVAKAAGFVSEAVRDVRTVVKGVSSAFGGFKNAAEALIALKVVSWLRGTAVGVGLVGTEATVATGKVAGLRAALSGLGAISIAPIVIPVALSMAAKEKDWLKKHLGKGGAAAFDAVMTAAGGGIIGGPKAVWNDLFGDDSKAAGTPKPHSGTGFKDADLSNPAGRGGTGAPLPLDSLSRIQNNTAAARLAVAKKAPGAQAQLVAALKAQIDFDRKYEAIQARLVAKGGKDAKKHAQKLQGLYADETSALDEINGINEKALSAQERAAKKAAAAARKAAALAKKRREAEKKAAAERERIATTFTVPMALQIAQARAGTTVTKADDIAVAEKIKRFAEQTIKSNKKKGQALVDAWNEIAAQLQVLGGRQASQAVAVSSEMLTAGLNLSRAQRKVLEARYAQASAHGGHRSSGIGVAGQTVVIHNHNHTYLDGKEIARSTTTHQQRDGAHSAVQVRGPHAGRNPRVH